MFKRLAPPCLPGGTLPRCMLQVGCGQEIDGLKDEPHPRDGVCIGDHCGEKGDHGKAGTYPGALQEECSVGEL